ncbi:hypothetical protein [Dyella flagellata]|nr:hypothetical protein [Dyella flagellata]
MMLSMGLLSGGTVIASPVNHDKELQAIARKCEVPRTWMKMSSDGVVSVTAPETATYGQVICMVNELKDHKIPAKSGLVSGDK